MPIKKYTLADYDPQLVERILELKKAGGSIRSIARELKLPTTAKVVRILGLSEPKPAAAAIARRMSPAGQANIKRAGITAREFILKQPATMSSHEVADAGKKLGLKFSLNQVTHVRRAAGIRTQWDRARGDARANAVAPKPAKRDGLALVNHALKRTRVENKATDRLLRALVTEATKALRMTNIHRLTIDLQRGEYRAAYEHEEKGEL